MTFGQELNPGSITCLYQIDLTTALKIPAGWTTMMLRFADSQQSNGSSFTFGGTTYTFTKVQFSGLTLNSGSGSLPTPTLELGSGTQTATGGLTFGFLNQGGDMRGATVTRIKIPTKFLDGQPNASTDPSNYKRQTFVISQMESRHRHTLKFELSGAKGLDSLNANTNRVLSSNRCNLIYRIWDTTTGSFKYTPEADGGCPWAQSNQSVYPNCGSNWGTPYFDANNNVVAAPANDRCSLSVEGCLKRFPVTGATTDVFPISINLKGGTKGTS